MISSCQNSIKEDSKYYCKKLEFECKRKNTKVVFKTSKGDLDVQLFGVTNPITVSNFVENIKTKIYSEILIYKVLDYSQVKIFHSGIYPEKNFYKKESNDHKLMTKIPLEIHLKKGKEPIYLSQIDDMKLISNLDNIFQKGSLAMVKIGNKYSSSTEFFFTTNKIPELDGRYSIFGKVVRGFDVLEKLEKNDLIKEIKLKD